MIPDSGPTDPRLSRAFRYCPRCATPGPAILDNRQLQCPCCGLRFFFNTAAAAAVFLFAGNRLVLGVRAEEPRRGCLDVPGGFIEFDESVEAGLRREVREELGVEIRDLRYLASFPNDYLYADIPYKTADLFFVGAVADPAHLRAADDIAELVLLEPAAVDPARFAFASTRRAFQVLLAALAIPAAPA